MREGNDEKYERKETNGRGATVARARARIERARESNARANARATGETNKKRKRSYTAHTFVHGAYPRAIARAAARVEA